MDQILNVNGKAKQVINDIIISTLIAKYKIDSKDLDLPVVSPKQLIPLLKSMYKCTNGLLLDFINSVEKKHSVNDYNKAELLNTCHFILTDSVMKEEEKIMLVTKLLTVRLESIFFHYKEADLRCTKRLKAMQQ